MTKKKGKEAHRIDYKSLKNDKISDRCKNLMYVLEHDKSAITKRQASDIFISLFEKSIYFDDNSDIEKLRATLPETFTNTYIERTKTRLYLEIEERIKRSISSYLSTDASLPDSLEIAKKSGLPHRIVKKHLERLEQSDLHKLKRAKIKLAFEDILMSCYQNGKDGDVEEKKLFLEYAKLYLFDEKLK